MKLFRVRRLSGKKGGYNYYHHADVIADSGEQLISACKNGEVGYWRRVDRFDESSKDYVEYRVLGEIGREHCEYPKVTIIPKTDLSLIEILRML